MGGKNRVKKIGVITVGQTPRTDLVPEIQPILGDSVEIIQMGGLDGLTKEEIAAFRPVPGDHVLVSRLADGSSVTFGESYVLPRLAECIRKLEAQDVSLILFLCTGEFPENFHSRVPLIFPNRLLSGVIPAVGSRFLTVLTPAAEQLDQIAEKWSPYAGQVHGIAVSPYGSMDAVLSAAETIPAETDLILLDCIGYTVEMKEKIRDLTGKPVILPRTLTARMICELV